MILALFENGAAAEIKVALYRAPGDRARLLDAYVTTECEGAVTRSARRAAEAILNWLPLKEQPQQPLVAGFDLAGVAASQTLAGESAGLAFAVALAAQLTGHDPGTVTVTGILAEGSAATGILPVKGLAEKLEAALQQPGVTTILFPAANRGEIDPAMTAAAQSKGVRLAAISRLDEALALLFPSRQPQPSQRRASPLGLVGAMAAGIVIIAVIYWLTVRTGAQMAAIPPGKDVPAVLPASSANAAAETSHPAATAMPSALTAQKPAAVEPVKTAIVEAALQSVQSDPAKAAAPRSAEQPVAAPVPLIEPKPPVKSGGGFD